MEPAAERMRLKGASITLRTACHCYQQDWPVTATLVAVVGEVPAAAAVLLVAAAAHGCLCSRSHWIVMRRGYPSRARVLPWTGSLLGEVDHRLMLAHKEHP